MVTSVTGAKLALLDFDLRKLKMSMGVQARAVLTVFPVANSLTANPFFSWSSVASLPVPSLFQSPLLDSSRWFIQLCPTNACPPSSILCTL